MPYISKQRRATLTPKLIGVPPAYVENAGELNYLITSVLLDVMEGSMALRGLKPFLAKMFDRYIFKTGLRYAYINDIIGAIEGASLELIRRTGSPEKRSRWETPTITLAHVLAHLAEAKIEFYMRVAGPYEDQKIKENGDVYPFSIVGEVK